MGNVAHPSVGRLFAVRHGETNWSLSGQHTGRTDVPLTDRGRDLARRLRPVLSGEAFGLVLTSPLARARETCSLCGLADVATIDTDLYIEPYGFIVVADDASATKNGGLPGTVVSWQKTDVLVNGGDTIEIIAATSAGDVSIDKVTYPAFDEVPVGKSLSFPALCAPGGYSDWNNWSTSFQPYGTSGTLLGTPNSENVDVACPTANPPEEPAQ